MSKRKAETKADIIAVLILTHCKRGDGKPIISRREAREKQLSAEQIIRAWRSQVIRQHGGAKATDGSCEPYNIWYTPREIDAIETPRDISRIAKGKRIAKKQREHKARMSAKLSVVIASEATPKRQKPKRSWPRRTFAQQRGFRA